jgi:hypothetical protein
MIKRTSLLLLGLLAFSLCARAADPAAAPTAPSPWKQSLYSLRITAQRYEAAQPWKKGATERRLGYAVAVGSNQLVTTEQLVRDATLVEISPAGSARFYPVNLLRADRDLNLALLDVTKADLPQPPRPLELTALPFPGTRGAFIQFEDGGIIQEGSVQILRASLDSPAEGAAGLLTLQFLADIPLNGQGLPILQEGRLAGLSVSYDRSSKIGQLYPGRTLKRFAEEAARPDYLGLPVAGLSWKPLPDPAKRRYLAAPEGDRGVQIVSTTRGTDASTVFQSGDVLTSWLGYPIDQQGFYDDPALGRIPFPALIATCRPGDSIPVTYSRNGMETQAVVRLMNREALLRRVPERENGQPPYLVEGGMVMRDLSGDYLRAHGYEWIARANPRLVHLYLTRGDEEAPRDERFPVLSLVLPDSINVGYQDFRDEVIVGVNGEAVTSLRDILRVRERDGAISRIRLMNHEVDLALDTASLKEANARIAESYRIPSLLVR